MIFAVLHVRWIYSYSIQYHLLLYIQKLSCINKRNFFFFFSFLVFLFCCDMGYTTTILAVLIAFLVLAIWYVYNCHLQNISYHNGIETWIINNEYECIKCLNKLLSLNPKVLALDCEWVYNKKISLIQIGNDKIILLIRIHLFKSIPMELISLLNNNQILKVGVGIFNDKGKLFKDYGIKTYGILELNHLYNHHNKASSYLSMKKLAKIVLNENMKFKTVELARSNWEAKYLSEKQIYYAADDTFIPFKIFYKILNINDFDDSVDFITKCYGLIDNNNGKQFKFNNIKSNNTINNDRNISGYELTSRTKDFFDNCKFLKQDGSIYAYGSKKKMNWYIRHKLCDIIDDETIQLNFDPKPIPTNYTKQPIDCKCMICGNNNQLSHFRVIPEIYRKYLSELVNDRAKSVIDHIPLCLLCHKKAKQNQIEYRENMCKKYDVPSPVAKNQKKGIIPFRKAKKSAKLLQTIINKRIYSKNGKMDELINDIHKEYKNNTKSHIKWLTNTKIKKKLNALKVPRIKQLEAIKIICEFKNVRYDVIFDDNVENQDSMITFSEFVKIDGRNDDETNSIIQCIIDEINEYKCSYDYHSKMMVNVFENKHELFVQLWRLNFHETFKPQYLPDSWLKGIII